MGNSYTPAVTADSRVFLIEGRARGDHAPSYESCIRMTALSQSFGDVERIECPDPYQYGKFVEVGSVRGGTERATTSLEGRYARDLISDLLKLARKNCAVDVQLHLGSCTDPSDFDTFTKAVILEQAYLTNFGTEDLGTLDSGGNAVINETADISAKEVYEVVPISFGIKAGSIVANEVVDAALCDSASCGDCEEESDGCQKIYAVTVAAGGSPATSPDILFTPDKGITWYSHDIETITGGDAASGVECVGAYVVVVSNDSGSLHYALKSEFEDLLDPDFTEVLTGFVAGGEPNAIFAIGNKAFVAGDGGYIYSSEDITSGVDVLDAGVSTTSALNDVHAFSEEMVVAVGNNGVVLYSENGTTFALTATAPVGFGVNLNCVFVKSEKEWWVGSSAGGLFYTLDGGDSWTAKAFPGSGAGAVHDIEFATDSVAYLSHATAAPVGRIFRSYDGGYSWKATPERTGATLPDNDRVNVLVTCPEDVNFVAGFGLAGDGTDGYVVVGSAS